MPQKTLLPVVTRMSTGVLPFTLVVSGWWKVTLLSNAEHKKPAKDHVLSWAHVGPLKSSVGAKAYTAAEDPVFPWKLDCPVIVTAQFNMNQAPTGPELPWRETCNTKQTSLGHFLWSPMFDGLPRKTDKPAGTWELSDLQLLLTSRFSNGLR